MSEENEQQEAEPYTPAEARLKARKLEGDARAMLDPHIQRAGDINPVLASNIAKENLQTAATFRRYASQTETTLGAAMTPPVAPAPAATHCPRCAVGCPDESGCRDARCECHAAPDVAPDPPVSYPVPAPVESVAELDPDSFGGSDYLEQFNAAMEVLVDAATSDPVSPKFMRAIDAAQTVRREHVKALRTVTPPVAPKAPDPLDGNDGSVWVIDRHAARLRAAWDVLSKRTAAEVPDTERAGAEVTRVIDGKFHVANGQIVKTSSGEIVPEWEPLFLLRGRDRLTLPSLRIYRKMSVIDGCTDIHLAGVDAVIAKFEAFAVEHPEWMKQPGVTRGAAFAPSPIAPPATAQPEHDNSLTARNQRLADESLQELPCAPEPNDSAIPPRECIPVKGRLVAPEPIAPVEFCRCGHSQRRHFGMDFNCLNCRCNRFALPDPAQIESGGTPVATQGDSCAEHQPAPPAPAQPEPPEDPRIAMIRLQVERSRYTPHQTPREVHLENVLGIVREIVTSEGGQFRRTVKTAQPEPIDSTAYTPEEAGGVAFGIEEHGITRDMWGAVAATLHAYGSRKPIAMNGTRPVGYEECMDCDANAGLHELRVAHCARCGWSPLDCGGHAEPEPIAHGLCAKCGGCVVADHVEGIVGAQCYGRRCGCRTPAAPPPADQIVPESPASDQIHSDPDRSDQIAPEQGDRPYGYREYMRGDHVHPCPLCHKRNECAETCSVEGDGERWIGGFVECCTAPPSDAPGPSGACETVSEHTARTGHGEPTEEDDCPVCRKNLHADEPYPSNCEQRCLQCGRVIFAVPPEPSARKVTEEIMRELNALARGDGYTNDEGAAVIAGILARHAIGQAERIEGCPFVHPEIAEQARQLASMEAESTETIGDLLTQLNIAAADIAERDARIDSLCKDRDGLARAGTEEVARRQAAEAQLAELRTAAEELLDGDGPIATNLTGQLICPRADAFRDVLAKGGRS